MISPTTVTTLPGNGLLSTAAAMVVWVHGLLALVPISPAGFSKLPFSGVIFGLRMSAAPTPAITRQARIPSASAAFLYDMVNLLATARRRTRHWQDTTVQINI